MDDTAAEFQELLRIRENVRAVRTRWNCADAAKESPSDGAPSSLRVNPWNGAETS